MTDADWNAADPDELDALGALGPEGTWHFDGVDLALTNLDKVLFPARHDGGRILTKRDLIAYHARSAPWELPYLADRPVNLRRFPDGVDHAGFWSKARPKNAPDWLGRWRNADADEGETVWYSVADRPAALVYLANLGAIEFHPWTSARDAPDRPTWAYIDIDPGPANDFGDVLEITLLYRTALETLGVVSGPKITGGRGIHIWIPIEPTLEFARTRAWVETLSRAVGEIVPDLVSWKWRVADRGGLARLDYTQNAVNKTLVAPFSPRARPGAPVSVPIRWDEVDDGLTPDRFGLDDIADRLAVHADPLADLIGLRQGLPELDEDTARRAVRGSAP